MVSDTSSRVATDARWHAGGWLFGTVLLGTAIVLAVIVPQMVAVRGATGGVLAAMVIVTAGVIGTSALARLRLDLTPDDVIIRGVVVCTVIARDDVLGVAADRAGVSIWYRDGSNVARVTASAAAGALSGDLSRSRSHRIAAVLGDAMNVSEPTDAVRSAVGHPLTRTA